MLKIKRALISVSDKTGLIEFAAGLAKWGIEIISTGGTAKTLRDNNIETVSISQVTDFPEMLEGRVKTLHPAIHGGLLAKRDKPMHMKALEELDIKPIDMVVVNLYPFAETIAKPGITMAEAFEQIDIGGPTMIRSASKNCVSVATVTDPEEYDLILKEMEENRGSVSGETSYRLACKAFAHTAAYDGVIAEYLSGGRESFPPTIHLSYNRAQTLRYGENPHQQAAFYSEAGLANDSLAGAKQMRGKEMSYNNWLDLQAAWQVVQDWDIPAISIIKHNNPCGVAVAETIEAAYSNALASDPVSAFGGIVAANREIDGKTARKLKELFVEAVVAPGFSGEALDLLKRKKDLRILTLPLRERTQGLAMRAVDGGMLVQEADWGHDDVGQMEVVSTREPDEEEWKDLLFAWKVCKHVRSNAIVIAKEQATLGIGAGQMSRVDSAFMAIHKAGERAGNTVAASDAFFPFPDGVVLLANAGIKAIIQPGGSVKDADVIKAANNLNIAMVFTGKRHFTH